MRTFYGERRKRDEEWVRFKNIGGSDLEGIDRSEPEPSSSDRNILNIVFTVN